MINREKVALNKMSKDSAKQELIGQREGLETALNLVKTEQQTLENMIAITNKSLANLEE